MSYCCTLTIAGSDPSGGAGIQADLKTFAALGCYGLSVLTALTAQNTQGVQGIHPIPAGFIKLQLESLFQDIDIAAVKIGMVHQTDIIETITKFLKDKPQPLVIDPVMEAKGGNILLEKKAINALLDCFLPRACLLTPNLPEAEALLQNKIKNHLEMERAAKKLTEMGAQAVLLKGGHLSTPDSCDCLYIKASQELIWFKGPRILTPNTHGTGCTLSSAITALIARGFRLPDAITQAKSYLLAALQAGAAYKLGQGHGPLQHF